MRVQHFSCRQEGLLYVICSNSTFPWGGTQRSFPICWVGWVIAHRLIYNIPGDHLVTKMLHNGLDMGLQIHKSFIPSQGDRVVSCVCCCIQPCRRLLMPYQHMSMHLHALSQYFIYNCICRGKREVVLSRLQRVRLHGITCRSNIVMHFQKLKSDTFQILSGYRISDQKIILISILNRYKIFFDIYRARAYLFKINIINIKRGRAITGAFHINGQILTAYIVITVGSLKLNPAIACTDGFRCELHIIGAASIANLRGQLKLRACRLDQLDP
ncbi:hypothetical protein D3C75_386420 [compost metagenome]